MIPLDPITRWLALTRAVHFSAILLLLGAFIFDRLIVARSSRVRPFIDQRWRPTLQLLVLLALPAAFISAVGWLLCLSAGNTDDQTLRQAIAACWHQTEFGHLWRLRCILWLATAVVTVPITYLRRQSLLRSIAVWIAMGCCAACVVTLAGTGHGMGNCEDMPDDLTWHQFFHAFHPHLLNSLPGLFGTNWHQLADGSHLLISAAWPLGLVPLALLVRKLRREPNPDRWIAIYAVTHRFSAMALTSVILLAASGVANAWQLIGTWSALTSTAYGRMLLVKVALFALMVLMGGLNRLWLQPRLSMDSNSGTEATRLRALARLQASVWIEIALGVGIMIVVGLLGVLPPATEQCCGMCAK